MNSRLGNTDLEVSIAGFGVLPMGPSQLALPVEEGAEIIRHALRNGINFLDTAQYYRTYPYISKALENGEINQIKAGQFIYNMELIQTYPDSAEVVDNPEVFKCIMEKTSGNVPKALKLLLKYDDFSNLLDKEQSSIVKILSEFCMRFFVILT